jgi:FkbM family methyltransferase
MARKVFLDIGGHIGETVSRFFEQVENADTWIVYTFEPHPESYKILADNLKNFQNVECFNAAITSDDSTSRSLFLGEKDGGEGSTMVPGKRTGKVDYNKSEQVKAITLIDFLVRILRPNDHVVLKMNIEGGEYEIMQHVLDEKIMPRFAQIFIQLHKDKFEPSTEAKYLKIEQNFMLEANEHDVDVFYADRVVSNLKPINYNQPDLKGTRMKVAHFAEFGPHKSGLYGTTRDLIMAERSVGIDAALVDVQVKNGKTCSRKGLTDGDLKIVSPNWAINADILVHHSAIHPELKKLGIPIVLAIHGRPESTFLLEHRRINAVYGLTATHGKDPRYKAFFTFWKPYMFHLGLQLPKDKLFYVPAMVDLNEYSTKGPTHTFAGSPSILIVDKWRQDVTPFNVIMAAVRFKEKYGADAKIHILGAQPKKKSMQSLMKILKKAKILGEVHPLVESTALCYRGADMVITPHNIATRVVRESLACGTPIVGGIGNPYSYFTADSRVAEDYADAINACWQDMKEDSEHARKRARETAEKSFNPEQTGIAAKKIFEKVVKESETKWTEHGSLQRKQYHNYDAYLTEQKSKLGGIDKNSLREYEKRYHIELRERLKKIPDTVKGRSVLCLGARTGTEVKAFLDVGSFAVGLDLNPGKDNKYVVTGDFHNLTFPDSSVDVVFTNSLDHVYRIRRFLREIKRVLKPGGILIAEVHPLKEKKKLALSGVPGSDRWASIWWESYDDLLKAFAENGLSLTRITKVTDSKCFIERQFFFKNGGAA